MRQYSIEHHPTAQVLMDSLEFRHCIAIIDQSRRDLLDIMVDLLKSRVMDREVRL